MDTKRIARNLEKERCSRHNKKPSATAKKDSINLSCCCEEFKNKLTKKMQSELTKEVKKDFKKMFKDLGR